MSRPTTAQFGFSPRVTRAVVALIGANVAAYVLQLILLRSPASWLVEQLYLAPRDVYLQGKVWQLFTYGWLHSPRDPSHLLFNMLWLWLFGTQMETWWGQRRFLTAYGIYILAGGVFTVLVGGLCEFGFLESLFPGFPVSRHLGASGATLGITVAWGLTHADRKMQFFLLGEMTGFRFVLLIIGFQLLVALSFSNVSSTAHFGGIFAAFVLGRGLWRPSYWKSQFRKRGLKARRARIERELRVLEGGKNDPKGLNIVPNHDPDDPKKWN